MLKNKLTQDIEIPLVVEFVKSQFWTNIHGIFVDEKDKDEATLWCVCKILTKAQGWHNGTTQFYALMQNQSGKLFSP